MKKRRKTPPSRRRTALKWLGALVSLMLFCSVCGIYPLLPRQGAEYMRQCAGIAPMEVVKSFYDPTLVGMRTSRIYLMANEDALLLTASRFHPLMGWSGFWKGAVAVKEGLPVQPGYHMVSDRSGKMVYLYGRVDDPNVSTLTCTLTLVSEDGGQEWIPAGTIQKTVGQDALFTAGDGHTYFLFSIPLESKEHFLYQAFLSCTDGFGNPILWPGRYQEHSTASFEIQESTSTSILNN